MSSDALPKVAILMGGLSSEREVSLASGEACAEAVQSLGKYEVHKVDVGKDIGKVLFELQPDYALNALHGPYGEDGTIQGLLEIMQIPYTHSGVLASALAMDKQKSKIHYERENIPVAPSVILPKSEIEAKHVMAPP